MYLKTKNKRIYCDIFRYNWIIFYYKWIFGTSIVSCRVFCDAVPAVANRSWQPKRPPLCSQETLCNRMPCNRVALDWVEVLSEPSAKVLHVSVKRPRKLLKTERKELFFLIFGRVWKIQSFKKCESSETVGAMMPIYLIWKHDRMERRN